ncbi:MAG: hypothetical protein JWP44_1234 [Mucilaginibacter sp.]|nr:hypothetical protein [Mucilaginibacter sp.]
MKKVKKSMQEVLTELNAEEQVPHTSIQNSCYHPKAFDHSHGRINKTPFGTDHEPGIFRKSW